MVFEGILAHRTGRKPRVVVDMAQAKRDKLELGELSKAVNGVAAKANSNHSDLIAGLINIAAKPDGSEQLKALSKQIASIPAPKEVDIRPLIEIIEGLITSRRADLGPRFDRLETILAQIIAKQGEKQKWTFDVKRSGEHGTIDKVIAT